MHHAVVAPVYRLVTRRPITPHLARAVDITSTQQDKLAASHSGKTLELHHRSHGWRQKRQDSIYVSVRHRLHLCSFTRDRMTASQTVHRRQTVEHIRRH